ncbi:MAG: CD225/dispanin family protein [Pirellulales bacterium]
MSENPYTSPVQSGATPPPVGEIPNYLVQAILVTLCCCLPFGIVGIVYAAQVKPKVAAGDYAGAKSASDSAKMWCMIGFGLGLLFNLIVIALNVLSVVVEQG